MIEKIFSCCQCNGKFKDEDSFRAHIDKCNNKTELIWMWNNEATLGEVNERFGYMPNLPEELKNATKNTIFTFVKREKLKENVQIYRLLKSGFYISVDGKEYSYKNPYYSLNNFKVVKK